MRLYMSDTLKQIAQLEQELGSLPPNHSRKDFFEMVPVWMQDPDDFGEGEADHDWVAENADRLWLEHLIRLKKMKESQPDLWFKISNFD